MNICAEIDWTRAHSWRSRLRHCVHGRAPRTGTTRRAGQIAHESRGSR